MWTASASSGRCASETSSIPPGRVSADGRFGRVQDDLVLATRLPEPAIPGEAPRLFVVLTDPAPHRILVESARVRGQRFVDLLPDAASPVLGQHAHHRVQAALDRRRATHPARHGLVALGGEEPGALLVQPDEVGNLVDVDDVARDVLEYVRPLPVLARSRRPFES